MEYIFAIVAILAVAFVIKTYTASRRPEKLANAYEYSRKESVMTAAEAAFYRRLLLVAGDRYFIFPQVHLSSLLINQTKGRYWKAAFQRINRTSVDYVLCDKDSMKAIYAVELDDKTHDTFKRRARDTGVEVMLSSVGLPLVRFRDVDNLTDVQIAREFEAVPRNKR